MLWKDQVDVCTYANKEIEVYDMKGTKVIELNVTGLSQYLDQTNVGMVFAYIDNNSVFKTAYLSSTLNENKKDIEIVPKKRKKANFKRKKSNQADSLRLMVSTPSTRKNTRLSFEPFGDDYGFIYDPLLWF